MADAQARRWTVAAPERAQAGLVSAIDRRYGTWRGALRLALTWPQVVLTAQGQLLNPDLQGVKRFVFVCLGNINRSCFAEGLARRHGLPAASFGLDTGSGKPAYEKAIALAPRFGVDLTLHRTCDIDDFDFLPHGDLYLCMELRHVSGLVSAGVPPSQVALLGAWARPRRLHIHDPFTLGDAYFETCFSVIESAVSNLAASVLEQGALREVATDDSL